MKNGYMHNLNKIIDGMLYDESGKDPQFVRECDKRITAEVQNYTRKVMEASVGKRLTEEGIVSFVEEEATGLMECVCEANRNYLKKGMKLGAGLVLQVMEPWV